MAVPGRSEEPVIYLMSEDGVVFEIARSAIRASSFIHDLVKDAGPKAEQEPIKIRFVSSSILEKVVVFLKHLAEGPVFGDWDEDERRWEKTFLGTHYPTITHLNVVARHLNIKHLVEITYNTCWKMTQGKSEEALRKFMDEQDSFTYEDEEQLYTDCN